MADCYGMCSGDCDIGAAKSDVEYSSVGDSA